MADYWKSQAKKYCDFCKCWLADNKPSIEFHEKGKRHKENVQRRLGEITKKSVKQEKEKLQVDAEIRKMETAALKAYLKDAETNPDFSSETIKEMAASLPKTIDEPKSSTSAASNKAEKNSKSYGAKHFGNQKNKGDSKQMFKEKKKPPVEHAPVKTESPIVFGPAPKAEPYGTWQTIEPSVSSVDLELPEQRNFIEYNVPELTEENKVKFKEKKVESLGGDSSSVSFKKRKINCSQKRNVRQRLDEND
ncbi:WW domain-binding protein 4 [Ischnura elegans]|uniref:WW domain-binding protein 4 n=1 Tax=Ischnura elegans TaxID=197161 RepID=UPI001ED89FBE|nr:WW domain-binding protein 4 [Ischnura elegans]